MNYKLIWLFNTKFDIYVLFFIF